MKRKGFIPCCQRGDYNIGRFNVKLAQMLYTMVLEPTAQALVSSEGREWFVTELDF